MKIDYYTTIHKSLRRLLFNFSMKLACSDFSDTLTCQQLNQELHALFVLLQSHAEHEKMHFHPLIAKKLNATTLDTEHNQQDTIILELCHLSTAMTQTQNTTTRIEKSEFLYQQFNLFISDYLQHMAHEETLMPALLANHSEEELMVPLHHLFASLTQQEIQDSITYMLPAINPIERQHLLNSLTTKS